MKPSYSSGLGYGALSFALTGLLGLGSSVVAARIYGIDVVGEYALVFAPTGALWYLSSVKEQAAFVRELAKLEPRAPRVTGLFVAMTAFSSALTLVMAAIVMGISWFLFQGPIDQPDLFVPALVCVVGYVVLQNPGWNLDMVLSGFRAGRELNAVRLHQNAAFLVLTVVCSIPWDDVWGLVAATVASTATSLVHRVFVTRRYMIRVSREEMRAGFADLPELIKFGLKITPGSLAGGATNQIGTWVLGVVASVASVGAYSRAWQLGMRVSDLNFKVSEMLFPTLVERRASGDARGFDRALVDTLRYSALALLGVAAVAGGAATAVMEIYGSGFDRAADALAVILVVPAVITAASVQRHALLAAGRPVFSSVAAVLAMICTIALSVILAPEIGLEGAALAALAGYGLDLALLSGAARRELSQPFFRLWRAREMVSLALAYCAGFAVARVMDDAIEGLEALALALPAGTLAFALVVFLTGGVNARDRGRLAHLLARMRARRGPPTVRVG